jgi:hypothetical protein
MSSRSGVDVGEVVEPDSSGTAFPAASPLTGGTRALIADAAQRSDSALLFVPASWFTPSTTR